MKNPSITGLRVLVLIAVLALATALSASVASGAEACGVTNSSTSSSSTSMSSESASSTSSAAMSNISASQLGGPGSATASSLTQDAWLVKGDPASNDVSQIHGIISFAVHSAGSLRASSAGIDYGIAKLHDPSDNSSYEIRLTGLDNSPDVKYGGVALLQPVFGSTGVGPANIPQTVAYVAAFGKADILKNGQQIATNIPMHVVVTPGLRDSSGQMLSNVDFSGRQIFLHVPGPVEGLPNGNLTVGWNSAAIDLKDVGGQPMTERQIAMATVPGFMTAVAGVTAEVPTNVLKLSLRNAGFKTFAPANFTSGFTTITIVNNSIRPRGVIIKAKDVIGGEMVRYTPVLRPGQSYKFSTYLGPGMLTAMDYHGMTRGMRFWRSTHLTKLNVAQ
jgi:hypothetical protein